MNRSRPDLPVHHQLPESTQTHVHWVGGAIQPSHPLSSPSFPTLSLSQHQGLFQWVSSSNQVAKVLEFQFQHSVLPMNSELTFWAGWFFVEGIVGLLQPCFPGNKLTQKDNADSGMQFITPAGPRQSLLLAKGPDQHLWKSFIPHVYLSKPTSPNPLRLTKER